MNAARNEGKMAVLRAAILGLGQVGSRFDEEPRPAIWSHAGAYLALAPDFALVAGADPDNRQRERFQLRCPEARIFSDGAAMLAEVKPDVVSVCTPPSGRARLVSTLLEAHRPKVLICEKPLELSDDERRSIVGLCAGANVALLVNYTRRYEDTYRNARQQIEAGGIGRVVSVTVRAPNRLWSIGSHAVNLLAYLAGENPSLWDVVPLPELEEAGEPAANVLFRFPSGASGILVTMGRKDVLVFEAEIVGEDGRLVVSGNGARATLTRFEPSAEFLGYRLPGTPTEIATRGARSPFVSLAMEAAALARGEGGASSGGRDALSTESVIEAIVAICKSSSNKSGARA
jgi:predicted dehydrogenase